MNVFLIALSFLLAVVLTFGRGAAFAITLVYLPTVLLFSVVRNPALPKLPDVDPPGASLYGILAAGLLARRRRRLRVTAVDCVVALLMCAYATSAFMTAHAYRALSIAGSMCVNYGFLPYFILRIGLDRQRLPRQVLGVLVSTICIVFVFALIEFRLWPGTYKNLLMRMDLMDPPEFVTSMRRSGFFRASVSFCHPIDLGIGAALVFAMIAMLAWRLRVSVRRSWVLGGLMLALSSSASAISFTAIASFSFGIIPYIILVVLPRLRSSLPVFALLLILIGFGLTAHLASAPLGGSTGELSTLSDSLENRKQLIGLTYETAKRAGFFGFGEDLTEGLLDKRTLGSVDNAYLLITSTRGWLALSLWLLLPVCVAILASREPSEVARSKGDSIH